eukprot:TRINITY_DN207_c7_g1_i1.p1 TRINITY_DN207_c7_g1~~TRINITY_DN207_c7_g1_i1.p1  ORF type:complete len:313 (+),score=45.49 TRINITY_DN207_c7_g1_i1:30-968(+)
MEAESKMEDFKVKLATSRRTIECEVTGQMTVAELKEHTSGEGSQLLYNNVELTDENVRLSELNPGIEEGAVFVVRDIQQREDVDRISISISWGDIGTVHLEYPLDNEVDSLRYKIREQFMTNFLKEPPVTSQVISWIHAATSETTSIGPDVSGTQTLREVAPYLNEGDFLHVELSLTTGLARSQKATISNIKKINLIITALMLIGGVVMVGVGTVKLFQREHGYNAFCRDRHPPPSNFVVAHCGNRHGYWTTNVSAPGYTDCYVDSFDNCSYSPGVTEQTHRLWALMSCGLALVILSFVMFFFLNPARRRLF